MGLILKNALRKFIVGFPTVSDKYNVRGATLAASSAACAFGDAVKYADGFFTKLSTVTAASDFAGFIVGTNVKLADWPTNAVTVKAGEAFNLLVSGYIAVELDANAVLANCVPATPVYITSAGKITTVSTSNTALPKLHFTGEAETQGTAKIAEIYMEA